MTSSTDKLSSIYQYKPLSKYEGLTGKIPCRAPTTYVGVEIELEQVRLKSGILPSSINMIEDGSLKVQGREFTTIPIRFCYLEQELARLFSSMSKPLISQRCSVHVHLNARDFTEDELLKFLLIYLIFERRLFKFSGNRVDNIFCAPLYSNLHEIGEQVRTLDISGVKTMVWNKYSALNLCPLWGGEGGASGKYGTVEFRHMAGTTDITRIITWINLIISLKLAAKKLDKEDLIDNIRTMNTTSGYVWLTETVFGDLIHHIIDHAELKQDLELGVLAAKLVLDGVGQDVKIAIPADPALFSYFSKKGGK